MWIFDPPGSACIGLPPTDFQLILKKYHNALSWMYICGYFALANGPNREIIWIIQKFVVFFGQNVGIWPPGVTCIGLPPTVLQLISKKYHHALSRMYIFGYFVLSNGLNWKFIWIIPKFVVIFGQNMGIWPPGVPMYRVTPHCFAINFEEIPSFFILNVYLWLLCIIKWSKLGSYLDNTNIWGHFW
jgi:hypothetical protein